MVNVDVGQTDDNLGPADAAWADLRTSRLSALVVIAPDGQTQVTTNDGSFAHARTTKPEQLAGFLEKWKGSITSVLISAR